jgi:competence protein ComGF
MRKTIIFLTIGIIGTFGVSCNKKDLMEQSEEGVFIYLEEPYYDNMYHQDIYAHFIPSINNDTSPLIIKFQKSEVPLRYRRNNDTINVKLLYEVATTYVCDRYPPNILVYIKEYQDN